VYTGSIPEVVQDGVEDFQISARVANSLLVSTKPDCTTVTGVGGSVINCNCNQSIAVGAYDIEQAITPPFKSGTALQAWVAGITVSLSVVGARPLPDPTPTGKPITPLKDHDLGTPSPDGRRRLQIDANIALNNFTEVAP
jgi:hypothetical protein